MLAAGLSLDALPMGLPTAGGCVAVRFPRWDFDRFPDARDLLDARMKSVGEAVGVGKTYLEALQKAVRSLDLGRFGLGFAGDLRDLGLYELLGRLEHPTSERQFIICEALRRGAGEAQICAVTRIKPWYIRQLSALVAEEEALRAAGQSIAGEDLARAKRDGFADRYLSTLTGLASDNKCTVRAPARRFICGRGQPRIPEYYSRKIDEFFSVPIAALGVMVMILGAGRAASATGRNLITAAPYAAAGWTRRVMCRLVGCTPSPAPRPGEAVYGAAERRGCDGDLRGGGAPGAIVSSAGTRLAAVLARRGVRILVPSYKNLAL
jgi:hypothetical protein